ncbi:RHS repeat-associated core domain-containing protein [Amycolatopsis alkalitolerans]|uniref:RHS repeat protein n=1 Tax=Amycolatopsis alkalitolerans TaxID=2547244 RepID=A0A5C4LXV8_9PSEU|nr:RHS repeat-associated core domain-containing protein [Amycolatopsis alkalitolerans]TNC22749.1 RHS repeat protein [Amycolatopsis alkalitolerans]
MTNPLVAQKQDSTSAISGITILEGAQSVKQGIESGDWASTVLGAAGTAMDALAFVADPFGSILAAGVGWLMEHVGPLKEALDKLAGDPDQITAHSETWKNIAAEVGKVGADLGNQINADIQSWTGPAADAYRQQAGEVAKVLQAASEACEGASSGVKTAGQVVAAVRMLVRDTIAQVVGHLVSWALQVIATLGIGLAWVVPQVVNLVAKTAKDIAGLIANLTKALGQLGKLLGKASGVFKDAAKGLKGLKPGEVGKGGNPGTLPASAKDVNPGNGTLPSGAGKDLGLGGGKADPPPKLEGGGTPKGDPGDSAPPVAKGPEPAGGTRASSAKDGPDPAKTKEPGEKTCEFDPIDVATGDVLLTEVDLGVPGELGELIVREHVSSYRHGRWFGPSWTSLVDERLELAAGTVRYLSADAMVLSFPVPAPGTEATPAHGPLRRLREVGGGYVLEDPARGQLRVFVPAPGDRDVFMLAEVRTEGGESVEIEHDESGAPETLIHSGGTRLAFEVADGRVRAIGALTGTGTVPVATYAYDEHGHLATRTNSSPNPAQYQHDEDGRLLGWTDHTGAWYRYVYDAEGRCVRTVGDAGFLDGSLSYEDGRTVTADSLGHRKVFEFERGDVVAETDKLGGVTRSVWGPHNKLLARTDPLGRRTEFEHDTAGLLRAVVRPDGSRVLLHWTGPDLEIEISQDGQVWRREYDAANLPDPYAEQLGVDIEETEPSAAGTPVAERDMFGRPREVVDAAGARSTMSWTVEGGLRALTGPAGATRRWTYDGTGQQTSATDELGRVTMTEPGPFGTRRTITDPSGARTVYRYDTELRLIEVVNPLGRSWRYTYDADGRLVAEEDFDGRISRYTYDATGQLVRSVNAAGEVLDYRYDLLGNLIERRSAGVVETFRYDPVGRLVHAAGPDAEVSLTRDGEGRVSAQRTAGALTEFGYSGSATTRLTPSGVDIRWDSGEGGEPERILVAGMEISLAHDAAGRMTVLSAGGNPVVRQEFDASGRLAAQHTPAGVTRYHRRPDGSLAARQDPAGGSRHEFDQLGRVTAVHSPRGTEAYGYDVLGNLVGSSAGTGAESGPRRYAGTVIQSAGAVSYVHDARGRLVRRTVAGQAWTFTWDAQDQLTGVRTPDGTVWRYRYDPLGRRVSKQRLDAAGVVAEQVAFAWDGTRLVEAAHIADGTFTGALTWVHHPGDGRPVLQIATAADGTRTVTALVTDEIGTPVELVSLHTGAVQPVATNLWGLTPPGDDGGTPLRFPGQYLDPETGLHFNVFRYYDPGTARYVSPDPLGLAPAPNPVAYVGDPMTMLDPVGLTQDWMAKFADDIEPRKSGRAKPCQAAQTAPSSSPSGTGKRKADGTASSANKKMKTDDYSSNQQAIDNPSGPVNRESGRTESQGGGTTSGGRPHKLDGRGKHSGGSKPQPGQNTDVIELNKAAREGKLNPQLQKQIDDMKAAGNGKDGDGSAFIRGHLRNDNLGGPGLSPNLTPLSSTANKNMSGSFEEPLKKVDNWLKTSRGGDGGTLPSHQALAHRWGEDGAKTIRNDLENLHAEYKVEVSNETKFPGSANGFEHSIRDHLNLHAEWKGDLHDVTKAYLLENRKLTEMPIFPPSGTRMDTVTGEMRMPGGDLYDSAAAKAARRADFAAARDRVVNAMQT